MDIKAVKGSVRKHVDAALRVLPRDEIARQSHAIAQHIVALPAYKQARTISVYLSMEQEAMTNPILDEIFADKKRFYVPKVTGKHSQDMVMLEALSAADLASFPKNKWGIPEPAFEDQDGKKRKDALDALDLDLILVPGVAFDSKCNRLGHGKGYYDCFFQRYQELNHGKLPVTIGIALNSQIIESVPTSEHDKVLDMVATPNGIIHS